MTTLFCFGFGYSARRYANDHGAAYDRMVGTVRPMRAGADPAAGRANSVPENPVDIVDFDGITARASLVTLLAEAERLLVSIPPSESADPVLTACGAALARLPRLKSIVYLSTIGVYGDRGGAEVDEATPPAPASARSRARLAAEQGWQALAGRLGTPVAILRLSGIYGPGRNALQRLQSGNAVRISKPGQVFNRIHVADVAQAIHAAFARGADGIFNVTDDEPCPADHVLVYGAGLLGIAPPVAVPYAEVEATLSPMQRSFYEESKRVRNDRLKSELGVRLLFPTYRHGLRALLEGAESEPSAPQSSA